MSTARPIAPAIKEFFKEKLPSDDGSHTLSLNEDHRYAKHLTFLKDNLDMLQRDHAVNTIGLEIPSFMNVFLWAYEDGTLKDMLHSKEAAQEYMRQTWVGYQHHWAYDNAIASVDLAMDAIDRGMRVVAYDARYTYPQKRAHMSLPYDPDPPPSIGFAVSMASAADRAKKSIAAAHKTADDDGVSETEVLRDVEWFRSRRPQYRTRLDKIDHLITVGQKKIADGKLSSDALSATLFTALALPGNRITVGGMQHNDGIGNEGKLAHGTFSQHLAAEAATLEAHHPHSVTTAVLACTSMATEIRGPLSKLLTKRSTKTSQDKPIPILDIEKGEISELPVPSADHVIPLADKFPLKKPGLSFLMGGKPSGDQLRTHIDGNINPLLMPDIREATDEVHALFSNEPLKMTR